MNIDIAIDQIHALHGWLAILKTGLSMHEWVSECPDSKIQGANMGTIWGRQDPDGPHVGPMDFAIWVIKFINLTWTVDNRVHITYTLD